MNLCRVDAECIPQRPFVALRAVARLTDRPHIAQCVRTAGGDRLDVIHSRPVASALPASVTPIANLRRPLFSRERDYRNLIQAGAPFVVGPVAQLIAPFTVGGQPVSASLGRSLGIGFAPSLIDLLTVLGIIGVTLTLTLFHQFPVSGVILAATPVVLFAISSAALAIPLTNNFAVGCVVPTAAFVVLFAVGCCVLAHVLTAALRIGVRHSRKILR